LRRVRPASRNVSDLSLAEIVMKSPHCIPCTWLHTNCMSIHSLLQIWTTTRLRHLPRTAHPCNSFCGVWFETSFALCGRKFTPSASIFAHSVGIGVPLYEISPQALRSAAHTDPLPPRVRPRSFRIPPIFCESRLNKARAASHRGIPRSE
jgi:hypothetical protein